MKIIKHATIWPIVLRYTLALRNAVFSMNANKGFAPAQHTYHDQTGQDVEVDGVHVTYERFCLLEYFTKDQFVKFGCDDLVTIT